MWNNLWRRAVRVSQTYPCQKSCAVSCTHSWWKEGPKLATGRLRVIALADVIYHVHALSREPVLRASLPAFQFPPPSFVSNITYRVLASQSQVLPATHLRARSLSEALRAVDSPRRTRRAGHRWLPSTQVPTGFLLHDMLEHDGHPFGGRLESDKS